MLVSKNWLQKFVDVSDIDGHKLGDILTNAGLEVETISSLVQGTNLVIGQVMDCIAHPDSDHLSITQVDVGTEQLQIVCGAPNVAKDQKVIVAKIGAILPELTIKKAQVRGVESNGMICSLLELGLAPELLPVDSGSHDGIEVLDVEAPLGEDPIKYLGLDDVILDVSQTPNRSDFMSMQGVGREVAALLNREYIEQPIIKDIVSGKLSNFKVTSTTENCHLFAAKVVGKVEVKPSPLWIQMALIGAGMNPINNLVDISNLVMLETGQPSHFYDRDFFDTDDITVIDDFEGEVQALDDNIYEIVKGDTIITNAGKPIGIAGIKGLGNSMIQPTTASIVIEVASFDPIAIRNTAKRLNLTSDAQVRFIKPMDPEAPRKAMERILFLLKEYASSDELYETVVYGDVSKQEDPQVTVTTQHVNKLLGTNLGEETILDVFTRLNFRPMVEDDTIVCSIPSYRRDIFIAEDLIEEVIRVVGYDVIQATLPQMPLTLGSLNDEQKTIRAIEDRLGAMGSQQVVSYTLVSKEMTENPLALGQPEKLMSPLSDKREYIRNNLTTSLINVLNYNLAHKNDNHLYYELSQVYSSDKDEWRLGLIGSGQLVSSTYNNQSQDLDYYRLKGIIESLLNELGVNPNRISYQPNDIDTTVYHPYRSARIFIDKKFLGLLGETHPRLKIQKGVLAELNASFIIGVKKAKTKYVPLNKYPRVKRDIAIVVDSEVTNERLVQVIKKAGKPYLVSAELFDVYQKDPAEDIKSMAYNLVFESTKRTLLDEDVNTAVNNILGTLEKELKATLRKEL